MKKLLSIIVLNFFLSSNAYTDSHVELKGVNLTCNSSDQSINYNVEMVIILGSESGVGYVNNKSAKLLVSEANYQLEYSIADGGIEISLDINRTTGFFREVWISENTDPIVFIGKCKKVEPKF
tara:strand:+ start:207 stop:575 length:369 start_codon:yes stop_codon:yes gene_type:complete